MTAQAILSRVRGVRRCGNGWIALCPAHADRNPSLSIHEHGGKILICCHAGCDAKSICDAIHIRLGDLFSERGAVRDSKPEIVRRVERQIAGLRSRLTPRERVLDITVVIADRENLDSAIARALALAVEGEVVQVALDGEVQ
jgi:hypothetical protein